MSRRVVSEAREQRRHVRRAAGRAPIDVHDDHTFRFELSREQLEPDVDDAERLPEQAGEAHRPAPSIVAASSGRSASPAARAACALDGRTTTPAASSLAT